MPENADPKRPSFEERLEAVNQTLELVAAMQLDNEKRFAEVAVSLQEIAANQKRDGEHILALARIADIHERRLSHLEGEEQ